MSDGTHGERSATDQMADLVVYAPLGLALEARRLLPELAARGRRQVLFTRTIGKFAVKRGRQHVDDVVGTGLGLVSAWLPIGAGPADRGGADDGGDGSPAVVSELRPVDPDPVAEPGPVADHLAIPDYDSLSAFQVVPRLEALDPTDLAAVRIYEESTRARRTILNKIAQLS